MNRYRRVACTLLLSSAVFAQAPPTPAAQAEMTTKDAPITFTSRVNLVLVPVVVRDNKGNAVGNLSQQDFQLFDRGKLQLISRFAVERTDVPREPVAPAIDEAAPDKPQPPPPPIPDRFTAYLFDDVHLKVDDLARVRLAADRHLAESMGPTTRAAIFTTSGMGGLDFTDDQEKLHNALNAIKPYTPIGTGVECPDVSLYMADLIVNHSDPQASTVVLADALACTGDPQTGAALAHVAEMNALNVGEAESEALARCAQESGAARFPRCREAAPLFWCRPDSIFPPTICGPPKPRCWTVRFAPTWSSIRWTRAACIRLFRAATRASAA